MLIAAAREMIAAYRQLKASLRYSRIATAVDRRPPAPGDPFWPPPAEGSACGTSLPAVPARRRPLPPGVEGSSIGEPSAECRCPQKRKSQNGVIVAAHVDWIA